MTNLEVLEAARAKIAKRKNWTKGSRYTGIAFCALGAIDATGVRSDYHPATELLAATMTSAEKAKEAFGFGGYTSDAPGTVAKFNNASSHHEVIAVFDRAIARQRAFESMKATPSPESVSAPVPLTTDKGASNARL